MNPRPGRLDALPFSLAIGIGLSTGAAAGMALLLQPSAWTAAAFIALAGAAIPLALSSKPVVEPESTPRPHRSLLSTVVAVAMGAVAAAMIYQSHPIRPSPHPALAKLSPAVARLTPSGMPVAPTVSPPPSSCPAGMVLIPGGTFKMGSPQGGGEENERPQHKVKLSPYCMDKTEVTVAQYRRCVDAPRAGLQCTNAATTEHCNFGKKDKEQHPINCVNWDQADTYCRWAGGKLPTEAQWEFAARGRDGREYPWGGDPEDITVLERFTAGHPEVIAARAREKSASPSNQLCWAGQGSDFGPTSRTGTCAVGTYPAGASPFGLLDMAGNVFEWTADWYAPYETSDEHPGTMGYVPQDPKGPAQPNVTNKRVMRGGAWNTDRHFWVRTAYRDSYAAQYQAFSIGFRCAFGPVASSQAPEPLTHAAPPATNPTPRPGPKSSPVPSSPKQPGAPRTKCQLHCEGKQRKCETTCGGLAKQDRPDANPCLKECSVAAEKCSLECK